MISEDSGPSCLATSKNHRASLYAPWSSASLPPTKASREGKQGSRFTRRLLASRGRSYIPAPVKPSCRYRYRQSLTLTGGSVKYFFRLVVFFRVDIVDDLVGVKT